MSYVLMGVLYFYDSRVRTAVLAVLVVVESCH